MTNALSGSIRRKPRLLGSGKLTLGNTKVQAQVGVSIIINRLLEWRVSLLTSKEMESNNGPIRIPIVVNRLSRPNNLIRQRHKVPNCRSRPNILEVRSSV